MAKKLRVVIDTNVLISALVFKGVPWDVVKAGLTRKYQIITSLFICEELKRGLVKLGHSEEEAEILVIAYEFVSEMQETEEIVPLSRDRKDDPILATAKAGKAGYIVSGDKDLLILKNYGSTKILSPAEFLRVL